MNRIILTKGIVTSIEDRFSILVQLQDGAMVSVSISPTMKQYEGKIIKAGDIVIFQMSPHDLTKGRLHRDTFINRAGGG